MIDSLLTTEDIRTESFSKLMNKEDVSTSVIQQNNDAEWLKVREGW